MAVLTEPMINRNQGIDLLKIVSMFMVVLLHVLGQGGILNEAIPLSLNYCSAYLIEIAAYCAVNCYALASGYVGLKSKHRFSSIALLWLQVVFYSVLITVVMGAFFPEFINWKTIVKAFLPVTFSKYWYFTAYFGMWFFIPIMNYVVNNMSKNELSICLISATIVLIPISMLTDSFALNGGYSMLWLSLLYMIGAFSKKYNVLDYVSKRKSVLIAVVCVLITWSVKLFSEKLFGADNFLSSRVLSYVSPFVLLEALALLSFFSKIRVNEKYAKIISLLTGLSFSVYLIHTHPLVFNYVLDESFAFLSAQALPVMLLGIIAAAVVIYVLCSAIDFLRMLLFKLLRLKQILNSIQTKTTEFLSRNFGDKITLNE